MNFMFTRDHSSTAITVNELSVQSIRHIDVCSSMKAATLSIRLLKVLETKCSSGAEADEQ